MKRRHPPLRGKGILLTGKMSTFASAGASPEEAQELLEALKLTSPAAAPEEEDSGSEGEAAAGAASAGAGAPAKKGKSRRRRKGKAEGPAATDSKPSTAAVGAPVVPAAGSADLAVRFILGSCGLGCFGCFPRPFAILEILC